MAHSMQKNHWSERKYLVLKPQHPIIGGQRTHITTYCAATVIINIIYQVNECWFAGVEQHVIR